MSEPIPRDPHLVYGEQVGRQLGGLPEQRSRWAFELGCLERQVVIYQKVSRLCGAEHRLDVPGIVSDLWAWLLDGTPVPPGLFEAIGAEVPYPEGVDFRGFRYDVLCNLYSVTDRVANGPAYGGLLGETAECNIAIILRFLAVAHGLEAYGMTSGSKVSPAVLNHRLRLREIDRQQEDIGLLAGREYTAELGRLMRQRSAGYDLFDGEWFPEEKLPGRA
jgi:hypothetical protein